MARPTHRTTAMRKVSNVLRGKEPVSRFLSRVDDKNLKIRLSFLLVKKAQELRERGHDRVEVSTAIRRVLEDLSKEELEKIAKMPELKKK